VKAKTAAVRIGGMQIESGAFKKRAVLLAAGFLAFAFCLTGCSREQAANPGLDKKIDLTLHMNDRPSEQGKGVSAQPAKGGGKGVEPGITPDPSSKTARSRSEAASDSSAEPEKRAKQDDKAASDKANREPLAKAKPSKPAASTPKQMAERIEAAAPDSPSLPEEEKNNPLHPGYQKQ
jgi:hypothetical protein